MTKETKTYYIQIERQGNTLAVVKVEASSKEEAELKALKAYHATDDISEISKDDAHNILDSGEIDYILDEDGDETELNCYEEIDTSNLDVDDVIGWISDHEWLYDEFCCDFEYEFDEDSGEANYTPDLDDVVSWISEHDEQAWEDFTNFFHLN